MAHYHWWLLPGKERRCSVVPGGGRDQNWPVVPWTQYQQCSTARPRPGTAWPQHYTPLAQCHQTITTYHLPFTLTTYTTAMKSITHSYEPETKKIKNFKFILKYKHLWYYIVEPNLMPSKFLWLHSLSMFHKFWWLQMSDTESEHLTASFDASRPRYRHWSLQTALMCQSSA